MNVTLMMFFNQSILQLYKTYKNLQEKVQAESLIQSLILLTLFQSIFFSWKQLYKIT